MLKVFHIRYSAWLDGARVPVHGEFDIAAETPEGARAAAEMRWPQMAVEEVTEKRASN